jgi:uncharacterized protein YqeY
LVAKELAMSDEGLVKRIEKDIIIAMKAREVHRLETLRMVKTALKNREIDKREALTETEAQGILTTLIKQRRESVEQFTKGNRPELAAKEAKEIVLIEAYLPQQAGVAELQPFVDAVVLEMKAQSAELGPKAMGAVMKAVNERIRQEGLRADGRQVSELVKAALQQ